MNALPNDKPADEFDRIRPEYVRFTLKLDALLRDLLLARKIDFHLLESRTKETHSLRDKFTRSAKAYANPLKDVSDLTGIRVITYYDDDAIAVAKLVEDEFTVDRGNSVVHGATATEFGYKSAHYVIQLNQGRSALLEWQGMTDLKAEIQVRTVLQHAWAAISHKLQYKREEDVPVALKRKLFRLSALFELADDEFVSLRDASGNVTRAIGALVTSGDRRLPLDYVSLSKFIETAPIVAELCAIAAEVGFRFDDVDGRPGDYDDDNNDRDTISDLIQLAPIAEILTIDQFEVMLNSALPWAKDYLDAQFNADQNTTRSGWHVSPAFVCELIVVCAKVRYVRLGHLLRLGYARAIGTRVFDVAKQYGTEA